MKLFGDYKIFTITSIMCFLGVGAIVVALYSAPNTTQPMNKSSWIGNVKFDQMSINIKEPEFDFTNVENTTLRVIDSSVKGWEDTVAAEEEEASNLTASSTTSSQKPSNYVSNDYKSSDYSSGYTNDFKSAGVVYENGTRYTWYSQNVLPGGGLDELNSNGRHVDDDGYIRDGDGYIAVASSDHSQGDIVDTPWGQGKVYDSGCDSGTIDIYMNF